MKAKFEKFTAAVLDIRPEIFFAATAAVFGLLFLIVTPPFQAPDEETHFYRAYQVSELNLSIDKTPHENGGYLPRSLGETVELTATKPNIQFKPHLEYDLTKTKNALDIDLNPNKESSYEFSATRLYPPLSYLPQASGIAIGRLFNLSPVLLLYLGRVVNLAAWILFGFFAIKLLPRKKWALAAVVLIPMMIFQAASLSTDVMAYGSFILFGAYIFSLLKTKKVLMQKQLVFLGVLAIILSLSKQLMFLFLPLVLLIPATQFVSKKHSYIYKALMLVVPIAVILAWMAMASGVGSTHLAPDGVSPSGQVQAIIEHPSILIQAFWNTHATSYGDTITKSFIGIFGWVDAPLSAAFVVLGYIYLAILMLASTGQESRSWINGRQKILLLLVGILYWGAVNASLYLFYSPIMFDAIYGLQGRYFFPLALLAVPLLTSSWLRATKSAYIAIAVLSPVALLTVSLITIIIRYY